MRTVAVLGGGIGGLAASYYLCKSPQVTKVILVESSSRFGGWLWSTRRSDGAVFEHGPRGIRPAGAVGQNTLNMVEDLGLEGELLPVSYSHVASKNRYLYVNKQLHKMPSGMGGLLRTVPPFSRPLLLSVATEILGRRGKEEDESIHSFVSRRLGTELADIAIDSLCRGVFAGDCRTLSVRSCFPVLYNAEQQRGSLTLGFLLGSGPPTSVSPGPLAQRSRKESWAQWSLKTGVEALAESLTEFLQRSGRAELHRDAVITGINPSHSGWKINLEDGVISADHIISALPAKALSSVLPPSCHTLVRQLQEISSATVAVVNLEYDGSVLPVSGFGHLVPSWEDQGVLGVVYDSIPFPEHDRAGDPSTRLTVMLGGVWFQDVFGDPRAVSAESLLARAVDAVSCHLGVTAAPSWSRVALHHDCIPQYHVGHGRRVESMRRFIRDNSLSLSLVGSSFDGVSVNDVIFAGRSAVETLAGTTT
ncbi:protoporphyrinogen oxidase-like isoform X1 [Cololabis saira]|uniref:protoporphyrinogen oxidase-like isoform X1 n=1 Tax=Cololabis saira TaxID=129043 RepID=UPI002AD421C6|nr:protoporphyrinogen oxidase-like isoform X1 [Cololabis saira]